jgi:hypothetical protein
MNGSSGTRGVRDPDLLTGAPTHLLGAQRLLSGYGHVSMYDTDTLHCVLQSAGFTRVETVAFGEGFLQPSPDSIVRREESLYVEAFP